MDRAQLLQEESLAIAREIADPLRIASALNNLALVIWNKGDTDRATALLEESAAIKRKQGNWVGLAITLNNLGMLAAEAGDQDGAIASMEETLAIERKLGNPTGIADSLGNLAGLIAPTGDVARAAALDAEALEMRRDLSDRLSMAHSLDSIAATASRAGFAEAGARLYGAGERLREELGAPVPASERARYETGLEMTRSATRRRGIRAGVGGGSRPLPRRRGCGSAATSLGRSPREQQRPRERRAGALLRRQALGGGDKPVAAASGRQAALQPCQRLRDATYRLVPAPRLQRPTPEEGQRQSRAVGQSDPGGAHRAHAEVGLEKLPQILAAIVTTVPDSRRFREAASAIGDLLDVAEGVVAVEPGQPAGGRNAQQEYPARTEDAGRFGQCLLLEHRQRQLVEQNNRVVRRVRLRPDDDRWHERGGASVLRRQHQRTGVERMPVDLVAGAAQCPATVSSPPSRTTADPLGGGSCSTSGSPAIVIGRVSPLWTRFRRSAMIPGGVER